MWMRVAKIHKDAATTEQMLRDELICQSGIAIEILLRWLMNQIGSEDAWAMVPWWAKKAPYTLDSVTLAILKNKPALGSVEQMLSMVTTIVSGAKSLPGGPDLTALGSAVERYAALRRSNDGR